MQTLAELISQEGIRASAEMVGENPTVPDWNDAYHYKVRLRNRANRQLTTYFSMGYAHTREPSASDVLGCLASDAAGIDDAQSFEEWCGEYGYDIDSRKAEGIFKACLKNTQKLERFMGATYQALLFDTERL